MGKFFNYLLQTIIWLSLTVVGMALACMWFVQSDQHRLRYREDHIWLALSAVALWIFACMLCKDPVKALAGALSVALIIMTPHLISFVIDRQNGLDGYNTNSQWDKMDWLAGYILPIGGVILLIAVLLYLAVSRLMSDAAPEDKRPRQQSIMCDTCLVAADCNLTIPQSSTFPEDGFTPQP